jgi:hypothetical protein
VTAGDLNGFFQVVQKLHSGFFVSHAWLYSQNWWKIPGIHYHHVCTFKVGQPVWSSEFVLKGGEYEDFSIIAGDYKR